MKIDYLSNKPDYNRKTLKQRVIPHLKQFLRVCLAIVGIAVCIYAIHG